MKIDEGVESRLAAIPEKERSAPVLGGLFTTEAVCRAIYEGCADDEELDEVIANIERELDRE